LLRFDGELPGLDPEWIRLRKYKGLVLRDRKRHALSELKLWICDTHDDFGGRIAPQEGNAPGGKENACADGYGTNPYRGGPLNWSRTIWSTP
jgi:hypothetical protein